MLIIETYQIRLMSKVYIEEHMQVEQKEPKGPWYRGTIAEINLDWTMKVLSLWIEEKYLQSSIPGLESKFHSLSDFRLFCLQFLHV
jgi:hypothetical protein